MSISKFLVLLSSLVFLTQAVAETPVSAPPQTVPVPANPWLPPSSAQVYPAPAFIPLPLPLPGLPTLPGIPQAEPQPSKPYTMRRAISQQEKIQMMQMALPIMTTVMRMSMADSMNYFARKYKAKPGLKFEDVKESLFLRANQLNVKYVGENLMWKDFHAVLNDKESPRIEVYSWCDIAVARELLKISPEFVVFLPCRIVIMEDANKDIWLLMLDWSLDWVKGFEKQLGLTPELVKGAIDLNQRMDEMMRAAANGEL
jgi:uncharacterized protein (DUF302 family)